VPKTLSSLSFRAPAVGLFLLLVQAALGLTTDDPWFARVWQSDDGLPDNDIRAIAQSQDGYLWVATENGGLARFDGARFERFSVGDIGTNRNSIVDRLFVDSRHRMWATMNRGAVLCLEADTNRVFSSKDGLPDAHAMSLTEDSTGAIWVSYLNHSEAFRFKDGAMKTFDTADPMPATFGRWLATDVHGQLWFARGTNVGVFENGTFRTLVHLPAMVNRFTGAIDGGVWILTLQRELLRFVAGGKLESCGRLPPDAGPTALLVDHEGRLWVGTAADGLFCFDGTRFQPVRTSHREIRALAEDREGNVWVGTLGGGLNRLRPRLVDLMGSAAGLPFESLSSICRDTDGALWVVTRNGLVARDAGDGWINMSAATNWPGGRALSVAADPSGGVWIGTRNLGLNRFQNGCYTNWSVENGLANKGVRSLMIASNADLWVTTDTPSGASALQRLRHNEWQTFPLPERAYILRALAEDRFGNLWFGSADGRLFRVAGDKIFDESRSSTNYPIAIRCLTTTDDGSLWIGYAGAGVGRLKDGHYVCINSSRGLSDDHVCQIIEDKHGWFWFGGGRGIFKVRKQEMIDVAEGRLDRVHSIVYEKGEGVPGLQVAYESSPDGFCDSSGCVWMATRVGLALIHAERIRDNPNPPPVLIERVDLNGRTAAAYDSFASLPRTRDVVPNLRGPRTDLLLPPGFGKLDFVFTALSLIAPENVQFKYRLDGVDDRWVEAGSQRSASYGRLPAGHYQFHVIACNNAGVWNEAGATLGFVVLPFFWQTWTFRISALLVFTLLVVAIVRYASFRRLRRQLRLLEQQASLHRERARIAKDIHDDLGASLTQIALLGDLAHADVDAPEKSAEYIQRISIKARQLIRSLDEIVWAVNPRNDSLNHLIDYIGQFTSDFLRTSGIRCRLDLPENPPERAIPADVRHNLYLVVKEALNNVVKHARASEVWLRLNVANGRLHLVVEDNGRGFDRPPEHSWANGLRNMRQRLAEMGGECRIESRAAAGTKITFEVPWHQN
jgi:signal transduction histidine kinase/ligand-binding sensor domain-containing protein